MAEIKKKKNVLPSPPTGAKKYIMIALAVLLGIFLLSGAINQRLTGQSYIEFTVNISRNISDGIYNMFSPNSDLKATEDGVYFKNANPPKDKIINDGNTDNGK